MFINLQLLRTVLLWVIMQHIVVLSYKCFWKTYQFHFQDSRIKLFWTLKCLLNVFAPI